MDYKLYLVYERTSPYLLRRESTATTPEIQLQPRFPQKLHMQSMLNTTPRLKWFDHETEVEIREIQISRLFAT